MTPQAQEPAGTPGEKFAADVHEAFKECNRLRSVNAGLVAALRELVTVADGTMDEDAADAYGLNSAIAKARAALAASGR